MPTFPALQPYADMCAALCPIPAGGKAPAGLIGSFAHDWSTDPTQWDEWAARWPGCNWIMVAGPSRKIVVDIDVKNVGREKAWQTWVEWCAGASTAVVTPQIQTPSGGWHIYFDVPDGAPELRQPSLVPGVIDVRAGNGFVLIPPSTLPQGAYIWLP